MRYVLGLCGYVAAGLLVTALLLEFSVGCGATTYHADHTYTTNECIFIPYTPTSGRW